MTAAMPSETAPLLCKDNRSSSATTLSSSSTVSPTDSDADARPPPSSATVPYLLWIEAALFTNVFLAGFDGTVTASTYATITSEFQRANLASWISTAYLVTSTALQPLYGRLSDIFGRRVCLLAATFLFGAGCLGCALSANLPMLIAMRALTGAGGAGLMTMATIINTDLLKPEERGMYQAVQNILHGLGAILGASLGGTIASVFGWRFAFILQVPICCAALTIARTFVPSVLVPQHAQAHQHKKLDQTGESALESSDETVRENSLADPMLTVPGPGLDLESSSSTSAPRSTWDQVDVAGALLLIAGLSMLLAALSAASNAQAWTSTPVLACIATGLALLGVFVVVEGRTTAVPLLPLHMLHGTERFLLLAANVCLGVAGYGILFLMPLFFQSVLLDSPSTAGLRLVASSLATPCGGLLTGVLMKRLAGHARFGDSHLSLLARAGSLVMLAGALLNLTLGTHDASWHYAVYLMCGSFGLGVSYPSGIFIFINACEFSEHAVATYLIYLVRSIGAVCGVAAISTITQSSLAAQLTAAFAGTPDGDALVDRLVHSVEALHDLPPDTQVLVQGMYYHACRLAMCFLVAIAFVNVVCNFLTKKR